MKEYITEAVQNFGGGVYHVVTSPSERWLFIVGKVRELQVKRLNTFDSVVVKLLWILQRGRPDFATAISFLCKRMNHPYIEYWKKLKRFVCFMDNKIDYKIIIG